MSVVTLAARMSRVRPSPTAAISDKVRTLEAAGHAVINLGEGELDFDTPSHIKEAGIEAIRRGETKYTAVSGTAALKTAIAEKFRRENGLSFGPSELIAGSGAKQLIFNALLATVGQGDEVIVPAPYWVSYPDMVALAEGKPRIVACQEADGWKLRPDALAAAITDKTRWLILNSPNNPTGAVYSRNELKALADILLRHEHVLVMADDIYEHVRYASSQVPAFATIAEVESRLRDRTLTVNGVSKGYSMTGWRLGYAGGPASLIAAMQTLQSQSTSNASSISQAAAIGALNGGIGFMADWLKLLAQRRDTVLETIARIPGLRCSAPQGAFYLFVNCEGMLGSTTSTGKPIRNDFDFANYLLEEAHVGVVHGAAFGASPYVRIAYAVDLTILREACTRIERACAKLVAEELA